MQYFQIILSDAIVVWRAWIIWSHNRVVQAVSIGLLLGTLGKLPSLYSKITPVLRTETQVFSVLSARLECQVQRDVGSAFADYFGVGAWVLSWATNVWATLLIGFKAWCVFNLLVTGYKLSAQGAQ